MTAFIMEASASRRRAGARKTIDRPSTLRIDATGPLDVVVEDLSAAGFCFASATPISVGTPIRVGLSGSGQADAQVSWREGHRHGSVFTPHLDQAILDAAFTHDRNGVTAMIACQSRPLRKAIRPSHDDHTIAADEGGWRIAPFCGFALAMLAGGVSWKLLAVLLDQL